MCDRSVCRQREAKLRWTSAEDGSQVCSTKRVDCRAARKLHILSKRKRRVL